MIPLKAIKQKPLNVSLGVKPFILICPEAF